jgi:hypothetical protein
MILDGTLSPADMAEDAVMQTKIMQITNAKLDKNKILKWI